jgi:hypothetical protein
MASSLLTMARKAKTTITSLRNPPSTPYQFYAKEVTASQRVTTIFWDLAPNTLAHSRLNQGLLMRPDSHAAYDKRMWCFRLKIGFPFGNREKKHFQPANALNIMLSWLRILNKCQYWSKCRQIHLHCKIITRKSKITRLHCSSGKQRKSCLCKTQCTTVSSESDVLVRKHRSNAQLFATTFLE